MKIIELFDSRTYSIHIVIHYSRKSIQMTNTPSNQIFYYLIVSKSIRTKIRYKEETFFFAHQINLRHRIIVSAERSIRIKTQNYRMI